jgi:hypothetical protein
MINIHHELDVPSPNVIRYYAAIMAEAIERELASESELVSGCAFQGIDQAPMDLGIPADGSLAWTN